VSIATAGVGNLLEKEKSDLALKWVKRCFFP
jgi:hypothetical protein